VRSWGTTGKKYPSREVETGKETENRLRFGDGKRKSSPPRGGGMPNYLLCVMFHTLEKLFNFYGIIRIGY